jgi:sodium/bile acid cotransporter 7
MFFSPSPEYYDHAMLTFEYCFSVLSGVALKTEQFASAFAKYRFNAYVLIYNFGFVSAVIFGISSALKTGRILSPFLADGLIACGALPMAVNTVSVLTAGCHGDEAVAIFDEAVSNLIGVFLSPLIIRGYLGKLPGMNLPDIFWKLIVRVLVPLFVGQLVRYSSKQVVDFANKYKSGLSRAQKYLLVFIVYTIFCKTFLSNTGTGIGDVFTLVLVIFILQIFFLTVTWTVTHILYHDQPKLRVVGLFGAVAKTVALGIPLIQSLYENNPRVGVYTLPILIWHPMLLVVGSCLTPFVRSYVDSELERIEKASPQDDASKVDEPNREFGREETFEGESDEETPTVHSS